MWDEQLPVNKLTDLFGGQQSFFSQNVKFWQKEDFPNWCAFYTSPKISLKLKLSSPSILV
jgi:hypothetical protein